MPLKFYFDTWFLLSVCKEYELNCHILVMVDVGPKFRDKGGKSNLMKKYDEKTHFQRPQGPRVEQKVTHNKKAKSFRK